MQDRIIYLDNNATTKVAHEVVQAMMPFFEEMYGNPSSMHTFGGEVAHYVQYAREQVAQLLGATSEEIVFTSCGSESDNTAILGVAANSENRKHIVTTSVEHPAVRNTVAYLGRKGYRVTELSVGNDGMLDMDEVRSAITDDTALVTMMYANNETGVIFPVEEVAEIAKEHGAIMHVDAVQAVGKVPINLAKSNIDLLSLSGHKLHAPKGIGALYIRKGTLVRPLIMGGHQERGQRAGTEAVPSIVGLGKAAELAWNQQHSGELDRIKQMRDDLENYIISNIPHCAINGNREHRLVNTTNIGFEYIEGEAILLGLNQFGICASSGSACSSGSLEPSHVLRAMHIPFTSLHGSIRFSLSYNNTQEEIDFVKQHIVSIIQRLREISPYSETSPMPN